MCHELHTRVLASFTVYYHDCLDMQHYLWNWQTSYSGTVQWEYICLPIGNCTFIFQIRSHGCGLHTCTPWACIGVGLHRLTGFVRWQQNICRLSAYSTICFTYVTIQPYVSQKQALERICYSFLLTEIHSVIFSLKRRVCVCVCVIACMTLSMAHKNA